MSLLLIAGLPMLGVVVWLLGLGRAAAAVTSGVLTGTSLALLLWLAPGVAAGTPVAASWPWVPDVGLAFGFFLDGLGLFFAAIILSIGLVIIVYAFGYLAPEEDFARFFGCLMLFQGAMLGLVLSDNILLLVVFWELTSLSSFLLIGFWSRKTAGRQGARMALVVTGGGGLALLAGMVLLGQAAGSYSLSDILSQGGAVRSSPLYGPILALVLLGAFTKSAQLPFHFWLPHAMAAPTPVSAYLHSATMVKAGVFLLARFWPVLGGTPDWFAVVTLAGLATMLVAAWIALFKTDLKAILAYSTVSQLGLLTMLLGFSTPFAASVAIFHILNHATFKAALFMSAGIVDHATHTRDIRRLGGLAAAMPISSTLALVATAAMAGIPPLNGFISKEMMLEASYETAFAGRDGLVGIVVTLAALLSVAYSARFAFGTYLGRPKSGAEASPHPHDPSPALWGPVALLVAVAMAIGLAPQTLAAPLVCFVTSAVVAGAPLPDLKLSLWHGFTPALLMSAVAIAGGLAAVAIWTRLEALRGLFWRPDAKRAFDRAAAGLVALARRALDVCHDGELPRALFVTLATIVLVTGAGFLHFPHAAGKRALMALTWPAFVGWVLLIFACAAMVVGHTHRLFAVVVTSIVGLVVSLAFLQFSAPDLALTQISVEVVATILMLLALNLLPRFTPRPKGIGKPLRDGAVAGLAGVGVGALAYAAMTRDQAGIADYFLQNSKTLGGGTNVVNVILVDFRGFDTFGEIIVLCIAALVIYAMLDTTLHGAAGRRLESLRQRVEAGDAHPLLFALAARVLLPLALVVGAFIFLRGHNQPGGGFIAGLVVAIALLMQYMASGFAWADKQRKVDAHGLLGAGILIAGLTGAAAFVVGKPFLTSTFGYVTWPVVGTFELASAMAFDLGVFLTVVGTVMLALRQISRVEAKAERLPVPEGPIDIRFPTAGVAPTETSRLANAGEARSP
jgi:multicomponent K+:H+ antiporter subunit A